MSVLFTDTMTVYNFSQDKDTGEETWIRSVIRGIQWRHNKDSFTVSGHTQLAEKVESITVDFDRGYGNKRYIAPTDYRKLDPTQRKDFWTLMRGKDILVLGIADMEITKSSDIKELKEEFQYVVTVAEVSDNRNRPRLKHIKAVGKQ